MSDDEPQTCTTAEITKGFKFTTGQEVWTLSVTTDRRLCASGLTKGKTAGRLVANTLPELLRHAAALAEQGDGTLDHIAGVIREMSRRGVSDAAEGTE